MLSWIGELFWKFLTSGEDLKSVFLQQKITLVEHQNDVQNIGFQSTDVAALFWDEKFNSSLLYTARSNIPRMDGEKIGIRVIDETLQNLMPLLQVLWHDFNQKNRAKKTCVNFE